MKSTVFRSITPCVVTQTVARICGTGNLHKSMNLAMLLSMVVLGVVVHWGAEHAAHCAGPGGAHPSFFSMVT